MKPPRADYKIPQRLEFLPAACIKEMLRPAVQRAMSERRPRNGGPPEEYLISPIIALLNACSGSRRRGEASETAVATLEVVKRHGEVIRAEIGPPAIGKI